MPRTAKASPVILTNPADITRGVRALRRQCPILRRVHDTTGDPPLRRQQPGFEGLARIVVAQQVSAASAAAIWSRTETALRSVTPARIARASDDELRACGLSTPKMRTLRALAEAIRARQLDLDRLAEIADADIHAALTHVHGIGPWTADVYILFSLGRADAWAAGDLALQCAIARACDLAEKPSAAATLEIAERWRPWRGVAARLLWSFYALPQPGANSRPHRKK